MPTFIFHNYTVDHGLPSNECHNIIQDSLGYIWIATDRGLVQYDGYEFKTYGPTDGLTDVACMNLRIDDHDNLWINTRSSKIFIFDKRRDSIRPYKYQNIIDNHTKYQRVDDIVLADSSICFTIYGDGILQISDSGDCQIFTSPYKWSCKRVIYYTTNINGSLVGAYESAYGLDSIIKYGCSNLNTPSYISTNELLFPIHTLDVSNFGINRVYSLKT
ncbi:MAG TPA: two-component regulator propeller domain-containing protein, partial [Saprospiraceae bacterium]|nr:two-component regulator propeller domain-containing protein [Saprospiraceae bacterium]